MRCAAVSASSFRLRSLAYIHKCGEHDANGVRGIQGRGHLSFRSLLGVVGGHLGEHTLRTLDARPNRVVVRVEVRSEAAMRTYELQRAVLTYTGAITMLVFSIDGKVLPCNATIHGGHDGNGMRELTVLYTIAGAA